jgi:hypothetical protein
VSGGEVICDERRRRRSALMRAKATSSSASAQSPRCLDRHLRTRRASTVAPRRPNGPSCAPQPPRIRGMSD